LNPCPYKIGDKYRFKPAAYAASAAGFGSDLEIEVTGTVVQIHEEHSWYRVSYETPQGIRYGTDKPKQPGVYIYNGQKTVVRKNRQ